MTRWLVCLTMAFAAGCSVVVAELNLTSVRPADSLILDGATSQGWHEGESCRFWLLGAPFGLPQVDEAMRNAMTPVNGAFMRDVTVFSEHPIYVLFGWHCYRVRGEVFAASS